MLVEQLFELGVAVRCSDKPMIKKPGALGARQSSLSLLRSEIQGGLRSGGCRSRRTHTVAAGSNVAGGG